MNSTSSTLNALLIGVIVVAIMFFAREVLIPLALAGILSFMLAPPVRALQRLRLPRSLAVTIVVLIAFAAIFELGRVLATQVTSLAEDLPKYQATISQKIEGLRGSGGGGATLKRAQAVLRQLDKQIEDAQSRASQEEAAPTGPAPDSSPIPVEVHEPTGGPLRTLVALVNPLLGPLATTILIVVFIIFILIQREDLRDRLIRLVGATDIPHMTAALDDAGHRLSHLFLTQLAVNSGFGAAKSATVQSAIDQPGPEATANMSGKINPRTGPTKGTNRKIPASTPQMKADGTPINQRPSPIAAPNPELTISWVKKRWLRR